MDTEQLKKIIEAALLAAGQPLSIDRILSMFPEDAQPGRQEIRSALDALRDDCTARGVELKEVGSGYRFQAKQELSPWLSRLWEERPSRYSRALMETLALVAYRQPVTRAEIEEVRGVSVSTSIMKTLLEREWVRVVGHRDVPGKPAMYGTTRHFLDYFGLKSLDDLPKLADIRDIDSLNAQLDLSMPGEEGQRTELAAGEEAGEAESGEAEDTAGAAGAEVVPISAGQPT